MDIQQKNKVFDLFKKTNTFKYFYSTLLRFDYDLNCFVATEKWRNKEAELLTAAWWMFEEAYASLWLLETEQAAKANAVPETLKNDCMIGQNWFMKGSSVSALIKHAEDVYKAEVIAQNSKIKFGTDDNEHWFAHDVPFFGRVQIDRIEEHGLVEWDIVLDGCWQGPFESKARCIQHLEECILEQRAEAQEPSHD